MRGHGSSVFTRLIVLAAWIAATVAACAVVFVLSFYGALKVEMRTSEVTVPDFVGMTQPEATAAAGPLDLPVEIVEERHDPRVSSGRILQQEPTAGSSVRRGRRVKAVLSLGGEVLAVPALVGQRSRAVEIELKRQGFAPGSEARAFSSEAGAGAILAQVPPAGSPAVSGTRVHRLVSEGPLPRTWVMPDLSGRSRATVERWIDLCGFRRGPVRIVGGSDGKSGTVVGQLPLSGYPIAARGVIELTVAR